MVSFDAIVDKVETLKLEIVKVDKGNKAAAKRVRKGLQEMKGLIQTNRIELLALYQPEVVA